MQPWAAWAVCFWDQQIKKLPLVSLVKKAHTHKLGLRNHQYIYIYIINYYNIYIYIYTYTYNHPEVDRIVRIFNHCPVRSHVSHGSHHVRSPSPWSPQDPDQLARAISPDNQVTRVRFLSEMAENL